MIVLCVGAFGGMPKPAKGLKDWGLKVKPPFWGLIMSGLVIRGRGKVRAVKIDPAKIEGALPNVKHELFAGMVADGLAPTDAYGLAGFTGRARAISGPALANKPAVRARIDALLAARREASSVTLPEITDMLRRVFAGAFASQDWGASHNAAFSLARLHGLIIDRAQIDIWRRPARSPDAPAESALVDWITALPGPEAKPLITHDNPQGPSPEPSGPDAREREREREPSNREPENPNEINGLAGPGRSENGAPVRAVTGTPYVGALSGENAPSPELTEPTEPTAATGPSRPKRTIRKFIPGPIPVPYVAPKRRSNALMGKRKLRKMTTPGYRGTKTTPTPPVTAQLPTYEDLF